MMIKVAIAIGLGIFVFVAICCVSWGVWKLRHRMSKGQISATPDEIPIEDRKDVVLSLPTIKTSDLKVDGGAKLQCPLCWLDFRDEDIMRQLPQCDHIFHRHCIDRLLDKKITCPICSSVLTDSVKISENLNGRKSYLQETAMETIYSKEPARTPSWVHVNRPVPLPRTALLNSSSSSERFEIDLNPSDSMGSRDGKSPLLKHLTSSHAEEWNDVDLEKCIDISFTFGTDIPVEKRQHSRHSSTNDKDMDSFSFGISSEDAFTFAGTGGLETSSNAAAVGSSQRRSRDKDYSSSSDFNPSTRHSRSTSRGSRSNSSGDSSFKQVANWDFGHPHLKEVSEHNASDHMPLTRPPDQCSYDVLPVVIGSGNHHLKPPQASEEHMKVGSHRNSYSHL
ncbi:hypothetical protein M758_2G054900 [Ceratodon purpureus]|nr:hypothetical protein M758_2G054900 [Ceratodon purpureus]